MPPNDATPDDPEPAPARAGRAELNEFLSDAQETELLEASRLDRSYAEALRTMARDCLEAAAAAAPSEARTPVDYVYLTAAAQALESRALARDGSPREVVAAEVRSALEASEVLSRTTRAALADGAVPEDQRDLLTRAAGVADRALYAARGVQEAATRPEACYVGEVVDRARQALHSTIIDRDGAGLTAYNLEAYDNLEQLSRRVRQAGGPGRTRRPVEPGTVPAPLHALAMLLAAVDAAEVCGQPVRQFDSGLARALDRAAEARTLAEFPASEEKALELLTLILDALAPLTIRGVPLSDTTPALTHARRAAETALATGPDLVDSQDYERGDFFVASVPTRADPRQRYLAVTDKDGRIWALVPYDDALPTDHRDAVRDARCIAFTLSETPYHDYAFVLPRCEISDGVTEEMRAYAHAELDKTLDRAAEEAKK